jgi:hypothetical protein
MKAAHRDLPVRSLPGAGVPAAGGGFSSPPLPGAHVPPPAAEVRMQPARPVRPEAGTMDGWLLDRLFGRR